MAQTLGGQPGMTGYLHVNYHNRTPLNTELTLEGRLVKVEGRKTIMHGEMYADGVMTASAEVPICAAKRGHALDQHTRAQQGNSASRIRSRQLNQSSNPPVSGAGRAR